MGGCITTHALDLSKGKPAAGLKAELWFAGPGGEADGTLWQRLATVTLNRDGRAEAPLASGLAAGVYELRFGAGDYFGSEASGFLGTVPVRFTVTDPESHYHIPLLVSPGGYSTYRGS
ncbi:hydroxyisourate hydrolase [Gorillibacterium sp. sgz5001074]|uniref:hydroxyisourate hydrolase n=1 Tax=Gorillibacterium sp. sgz5001074 TaxID=3446695 RepID=UPI003F66FA55